MDIASSRTVDWHTLGLMRFLLAGIVVAGHLLWFAPNSSLALLLDMFDGKAAVIGFMLISGFSIAASIEARPDGYWKRRFLRIYPLYFFALLLAAGLEIAAGGRVELLAHRLESLGWVTALGNFLLLQTFLVKPIAFDGPVWSLSIEVFYYALAPLFLRLPRRVLYAIILTSMACYLLPKRTDLGLAYILLSKFNALNYLWCWLLGFLVWRDRSAVVLLLASIGALVVAFGDNTPGPLAVATYAASLWALLARGVAILPHKIGRIGDYLGDISYPLYLFHLPAFLAGYLMFGISSPLPLLAVAAVTTVAAYHLIDVELKGRVLKPFLDAHTPSPRAQSSSPADVARSTASTTDQNAARDQTARRSQ